MLQSSAYRQKRWLRRANSLSRSSSMILLKRGESGPPCGVPSSTGRTRPSSITPASRQARMNFSTRLSDTRDARHQLVVVDPVEKLFEIKVDHVAVALGHVALGLGDRLMSGASGSEAVAVLGKRRVPSLLENLQQGLLDQSVDDTGYAELSDAALRLGDFDPLDRLRLVGSLEQVDPDAWPVLTQVGLGVVDGHAIHARTAFVALNAFPRSFEVLPVAHFLHQVFRRSRAFRFWFRHKWFGPFGTAAAGFTPATRFQGQRVLDVPPRATHELPVLT